MKKIIFGISLMMALAAAPSAAFAAGNSQKQCEKANKECVNDSCPEKKCCKKDGEFRGHGKKDGKKFDRDGRKCGEPGFCHKGEGHMHKAGKGDRSKKLFEGITLSDAQQQKLDDFNAKVKADRDAAKAKMKEEKQKMRENAKKDREQFRAEYDKGISDILTPEQYAKYQENQKAMQLKKEEKRAAKEAKMKARKDKKGEKGCCKGPKDGKKDRKQQEG